MPFWIEALVCLFLLLGSLFALVGAIGLYRLPDFFTRLHGPTKATTLGVGGMLIASMIFFSSRGQGLSLHELLITLFLFITAPVSAHILAKAALQQRVRYIERTRGKPWE
jgi:multicomponent K+:H+ antiporter subunit G